jgi:DNA polymerase-3 subunit alpha
MLPELPLARRCADEADLLGYPLSAHPLELLPREAWEGVLTSEEIESRVGRRVTMIGWAIAMKLIRTRKDKRFMKFLSLEDLHGTFEAILFPEAYQRFAPLTVGRGPFRIGGRVEDDQGVVNLNVAFLEVLPLPGYAGE